MKVLPVFIGYAVGLLFAFIDFLVLRKRSFSVLVLLHFVSAPLVSLYAGMSIREKNLTAIPCLCPMLVLHDAHHTSMAGPIQPAKLLMTTQWIRITLNYVTLRPLHKGFIALKLAVDRPPR